MIKNIIFDFDGVILDSIPVKTEAFRCLFEGFDERLVNSFIDYHLLNGGMSRYLKIKYFYEKILGEKITDKKVDQLALEYSELTKLELSKEKYLIQDTLEFIQQNYQKYNMHIASGADEKDLRYICTSLNLSQYFHSINGSPMVKNKIVKGILEVYMHKKIETVLIGDSINDLEAAKANDIVFYGYNNPSLRIGNRYLEKMDVLL